MTAQEYDVVVVGSGGAGMVAALTAAHRGLSTVVIEKAPHFGGSTARSGGGVWIPNNEVLKRDGVRDTPDAARTYLHGIVGDVATVFYRADGSSDGIALNQRASGPDLAMLRRASRRVCVVSGVSKVQSLLGALAAGVVTDLICDEGTARALADDHD